MIPNGKQMNWNGHHLVFESEQDNCRGCFFADKDACPDCDEGLWIEKNPSPWHTETPTEEGWYLIKYKEAPNDPIQYAVEPFKDGKWLHFSIERLAWQKIEP